MLHVNDDSNDELFRRAAENYPLKTDGADWKLVEDKMNTAVPAPQKKTVRKWNYWPLLLLLLLIPLKMYENKIIANENPLPGKNQNKTAQETPVKHKAQADPQTDWTNSRHRLVADQSLKIQSTQSGINTHKQQPLKADNKISLADNNATDSYNKYRKQQFVSKQKTGAVIKNATAEEDERVVKNMPAKKEPAASQVVKARDPLIESNEKLQEDAEKTAAVNIKDTLPAKQADPVTAIITTKAPTAKKNKTHLKHIYIGLAAAPDFSTVKLQSVKKTGFNYGFVAGYRISKNLSIETGLFKDRKFYSTEGKYFNTKEVYLPGYATIEYVEGECNMLELPVNLYYTFYKKNKSAVFASAGVSSYFMKNESYVYDINHNGVRYPRSAMYSVKSTSLASVINISAGYTYRFGKICNLRIEPYVKLPINKIGTGSLPIQSAGIMVGITKDIF